MKTLLAAAALTLVAGAAVAEPVLGTWRTQPDDDGNFGLVRMEPCDGAICGTLIAGYDSAGNRVDQGHVGTRIVNGMRPEGGGRYGGGTIFAPDREQTYRSRMALAGDRLTVEGCVLVVCRGQTWARVE